MTVAGTKTTEKSKMEETLIRILQFMLSISLLVLLHEGGHFAFSKLFGVRVEKFYLFFDPWFHIFEFKPKNSDTTYGLGWLPLGGYCKISGMIDESFDTDQMAKPAEKWEFRSHPAWQRLLIMIGGVTVNFFLALFIYSMIMFHWGEDYIPVEKMTMGMVYNDEAKALGFQDHDILIGTDKKMFRSFDTGSTITDCYRTLSNSNEAYVLRGGKKVTIKLPGDMNLLNMIKSTPRFVWPYIPADVDSVLKGEPADKAGMKAGDKILAVGGKKVTSWTDFSDQLGRMSDALADAKTKQDSTRLLTTTVVFRHKGATTSDTAQVVLNSEAKMGIVSKNYANMYEVKHISYGFFESFPAGVKYGWNVLKGYVNDMKYVFTKTGFKSLGGFGAMGSMFPTYWDWYAFWKMTAFLSIILAFMNILPIPALDGGHVVFLLYEMITRRKPSENFMVKAEYVGITILLLLMVVANLNDILRAFGIMS